MPQGIVASGDAKSSTSLTTRRIRNLQTSPLLLKAVSEQSIEDILFHAKIKQRSNNIDPILTKKVVSLYNNGKISELYLTRMQLCWSKTVMELRNMYV